MHILQVPRPHISLAWAVGDICNSLKCALEEERRVAVGSPRKCMFTSKFNGIKCRVGKKVHKICKFSNRWKNSMVFYGRKFVTIDHSPKESLGIL